MRITLQRTRLLLGLCVLRCALGGLERLTIVGNTCTKRVSEGGKQCYGTRDEDRQIQLCDSVTFNHSSKELKFVILFFLFDLLLESLGGSLRKTTRYRRKISCKSASKQKCPKSDEHTKTLTHD